MTGEGPEAPAGEPAAPENDSERAPGEPGGPEAPAEVSDPERPADHSILRDRRLVAYLWAAPEGGVLARAGGGRAPICEVPFAEIRSFAPGAEAELAERVAAAKSLDALLFELGLEGYDVEAGAHAPSAQLRRF